MRLVEGGWRLVVLRRMHYGQTVPRWRPITGKSLKPSHESPFKKENQGPVTYSLYMA